MTARTYLALPINGDEGFPQSFRLNFHGQTYCISLYVNAAEPEGEISVDYVYNLPEPGAFMVMQVARDGLPEPQVIFHRKLVPDLEYEIEELAFIFYQMQVARRNLNGIGSYGSRILGGVAERWPSSSGTS